MNKLIVLLVTVTVLFWGIFLSRLTEQTGDGKGNAPNAVEKEIDFGGLLESVKPQTLDVQGLRNPFELPAAQAVKPAPRVARETVRDTVKEEKPATPKPKITLDAILPGDNPVAILKHNGESAVVSVGQEIWGVTVKHIDPDKVTIAYDGGTLELAQ